MIAALVSHPSGLCPLLSVSHSLRPPCISLAATRSTALRLHAYERRKPNFAPPVYASYESTSSRVRREAFLESSHWEVVRRLDTQEPNPTSEISVFPLLVTSHPTTPIQRVRTFGNTPTYIIYDICMHISLPSSSNFRTRPSTIDHRP
ncbi:hypothetical protein PTI98_009537 [Pleurotus ostreatus]|nr:hypothetical protein PTI98_009537 [Pleurotus ostreatus]